MEDQTIGVAGATSSHWPLIYLYLQDLDPYNIGTLPDCPRESPLYHDHNLPPRWSFFPLTCCQSLVTDDFLDVDRQKPGRPYLWRQSLSVFGRVASARKNFSSRLMAKRKRAAEEHAPSATEAAAHVNGAASKLVKTNGHRDVKTTASVIQIVAGSYERVLHGITASISNLLPSAAAAAAPPSSPSVQFADSFLFNAHASAIRCLALSPLPDPSSAETQGVYLATGGSDERINVYSLSATPVVESAKIPSMPTLGENKISENPRNRELGTLLPHSSNITALYFPTRSKLLSASEDNTVAVCRVKDLTVVSTVKAPRPKVQGRPSGDTAPPGTTPAGINDFAVHPSMKLMVSVGRGEKCMRLWNLVTGKKAGVLNFGRDILQAVKEGKYSSGEGRRIQWSPAGTEFAVSFERGAIVFGDDSRAMCKVLPQPLTKLHQICYLTVPDGAGDDTTILAVSTEDGRILFYDTAISTPAQNGDMKDDHTIPDAKLDAQLGGKAAGMSGRIKDFEILLLASPDSSELNLAIVTGSSDGIIRIWHLPARDLIEAGKSETGAPQVGRLIGTYDTGSRITCLKAFVMLPPMPEDDNISDFEGFPENGEGLSSDSDSDD